MFVFVEEPEPIVIVVCERPGNENNKIKKVKFLKRIFMGSKN